MNDISHVNNINIKKIKDFFFYSLDTIWYYFSSTTYKDPSLDQIMGGHITKSNK